MSYIDELHHSQYSQMIPPGSHDVQEERVWR